MKSASPSLICDSLSSALREKKEKPEIASVLGMEAQEATENPTSNVIDNHVQEIINTDTRDHFSPDINEIKTLSPSILSILTAFPDSIICLLAGR